MWRSADDGRCLEPTFTDLPKTIAADPRRASSPCGRASRSDLVFEPNVKELPMIMRGVLQIVCEPCDQLPCKL
jgi:hypothetical protein